MPLITKAFPALDRIRDREDSSREPSIASSLEDELDELDYEENFVDEDSDSEMDTVSILNRPRPKKIKKNTPAVPQRSELRASRIIDNLNRELKALERDSSYVNIKSEAGISDPHELYLSSEEEASESADDYDNSLVDLESHPSTTTHSSKRNSHEDVARIVSFMFVGKPQLITISSERPASKPSPVAQATKPRGRRPPTLTLDCNRATLPLHKARSGSLVPSRMSAVQQDLGPITLASLARRDTSESLLSSTTYQSSLSFLSSDPFPASATSEASEVNIPSANTSTSSFTTHNNNSTISLTNQPRTPTTIANSAWKSGLRGVSRTLSLAKGTRRKPSMGKLSTNIGTQERAHASVSSFDVHTPLAVTPSVNEENIMRRRHGVVGGARAMSLRLDDKVRYEDIMRVAIKEPPPLAIPKRSSRSGVLGRKKTIKS